VGGSHIKHFENQSLHSKAEKERCDIKTLENILL
jgi:hypothetical protein